MLKGVPNAGVRELSGPTIDRYVVMHETGHLLAARAFGMRVQRFSIGFGPPLWRYQAKGSP